MRVSVDFQDERAELDVPEGSLVLDWKGPSGVESADVPRLIRDALEGPSEYPPLRQAVVPGDRVVIALGFDVPEPAGVLAAVCEVLESSGVEREAITVLAEPGAAADLADAAPHGVTFAVHDPEDRKGLAYLANTAGDRRVYLNRLLTDADFVLPVGRVAFDPVLGYRGPWGVIFPGLSDAETRASFQGGASEAPAGPSGPNDLLKESAEVGWLLGCQFQVGLIAGVNGLKGAVAGLGTAVMDGATRGVYEAWGVRAESRAELVVVGVGRPGVKAGIDEVSRATETASRLVQRGGKIVVLSRATGELGTAFRRLIEADDPRSGPAPLRGHEADPDYPAARQLARALAWADVYLLSGLDRDDVEDLSVVPLERPEEARRLAAASGSCLVVSHADLAGAVVVGEGD